MSLEKLRVGDVIRIPAGRRAGYAVVVQANKGGQRRDAVPGGGHRGPAAAPADPGRRPDAGRAGHHRQAAEELQRQEPEVAPRPRHVAADRRAPRPASGARPRRRAYRRVLADRGAAPADAGAPVPRVPRPRAARAVGRALVAPDAGDRGAAAQGRRADQLRGADVRPDLRPAGGDGLPRVPEATTVTPRGEQLRRLYTEKDLLAAECLRHGVWEQARRPRTGRRHLDAGPRAASRGVRDQPADAGRARSARRGPRWSGCGADWRTASATAGCR